MSEVEYLPPAVAAERLHVSASGLRRLAPIYEVVHGELPRTGRGAIDKQARLWSVEAVERLETARRIVEADKHNTIRRYGTIQRALEGLRDGLIDSDALDAIGTAQAMPDAATQHTLQVLLEEMRELRREVTELREQVAIPNQERTEIGRELPSSESPSATIPDQKQQDGLIVRAARRLEKLLRGNRTR